MMMCTKALSKPAKRWGLTKILWRQGRLCAILLFLAITSTAATSALAQETGAPQSEFEVQTEGWERNAQRAQQVLSENAASAEALEDLRATISADRDAAFAISEAGSVEVNALTAQIEALGPASEDGEAEQEDILNRRAELNETLSVARRPLLLAQEAYERANVLIGELDSTIREQGAKRLLQVSPSPLFPSNWIAAFTEASKYFEKVSRDIRSTLERPTEIARLQSLTPLLSILAVFGLSLVFLVQPLVSRRLDRRFQRATSPRGKYLFAATENLSHLIIPLIGGGALSLLPFVADLTSQSATNFTNVLPQMVVVGIIGHWLGHSIFSPGNAELRLFASSDRAARRGAVLCQILALVLAIELGLEAIERDYAFSSAADSFLGAPIIIIGGLLLLGLAQVFLAGRRFRNEAAQGAMASEDESYVAILARLIQIAAILAIVVSLAGFVELSRAALMPTIETLGYVAFGYLLYRSIMSLVSGFAGADNQDAVQNSLLPIGIAFILLLAIMPFLALSWGARPADIAEVWRLMSDGVALGDLRLSLDGVIILVVVFSLGVVVTRWLQRLMRTKILPRSRMDVGAQIAIGTFVGYAGYTLAAVTALTSAGLDLSSFAVVAGALSVGIGFGLQAIVSNFVSGLILLIERPIKEGDWIEVSGQEGIVRKISVRSTRIETFNRHDVIVPNADLIAGVVRNVTLANKNGRLIIPIGVAYGSDPEQVIDILKEAAAGDKRIMSDPAISAVFIGLGASSLDFELRCYLYDAGSLVGLRSDLLVKLCKALGEADIEIPFPQQDIHIRDIERVAKAISSSKSEGIGAPPGDVGAVKDQHG